MNITIPAAVPRKSLRHSRASRKVSTGVSPVQRDTKASAADPQSCCGIDTSLIYEITRDALRRAALAPTYMEALDITGAALLAAATVARMGSSGGAA